MSVKMEKNGEMNQNRAVRAEENFRKGFNCCQSVFLAFADHYGIDEETALKLSCSFGGGLGRLRQVCGAVSGMALVCGLECGNTDPENQKAKTENYSRMRKLASAFEEAQGSIVCAELLGMGTGRKKEEAAPSLRTESYYKKRPCPELVRFAAELLEREFFAPEESIL